MNNPVNQFWILGRTFGALPAQLGFWIDCSLEGMRLGYFILVSPTKGES